MENIFALVSPTVDKDAIKQFLTEKGLGSVEIWSKDSIPPFINPLESIIILLLSGGTELLVKHIVQKAFSNVYVNCVPINNSITSAAELKGYYSNNKEITVSSFSEETFNLLFNIERIKDSINRSRLLLVGQPHEWLLTSENLFPPAPFQSKIVPLNLREMNSTISKIKQEMAHEQAGWWDEITDLGKIPRESFFNAGLLYLSYKFLLERYGANMLGIRCGDLLEYGISNCLALERLNREGIITACEGDIEAAFSMKIITSLTEKSCWMFNLSHLDFNGRKLYLTHCTMPLDMYSLGHNGNMPVEDVNFYEEFMRDKKERPVTLFRLGKLLHYSLIEGTVNSDILGKQCHCRSTLEVTANSSLQEWFNTICGNHQIMVYGNYAEQIRYFYSII